VVNEFLQHADRIPHDDRDACARAAWRRAAPALALVALLAWSAAVVRGGFAFDDREAIEGNPVVQGELPLAAAFARDYWHHRGDAGHYRPLSALLLRADRAVWKPQPEGQAGSRGFHATNVALHVGVLLLAAGALASLLARTRDAGEPRDVAATSRAVFAGLLPLAAHPVLADSVAWVSGRTSMIAGLGGAGAMWIASVCAPAAVNSRSSK